MKDMAESIKDATTANEMRAEMERLSRYDTFVHEVFVMAGHAGLSGEDKYTILAYQAIRRLQALQKQHLEFVRASIQPQIVKGQT